MSTLVIVALLLTMLPALSVVAEEDEGSVFQLSSADGFAGGDGTEGSPYQITNADELNEVRNHLDKHFILMNDINLETTPYSQGAGWEPIGSETSPFLGSFNGDNHKITGLIIYRNAQYLGLFGYIRDATIRNVAVENVDILSGAGSYIGALVGSVEGSSTILNTRSSGMVMGNSVVGGLIGRVGGTGEVISSSSSVSISGVEISGGGLIGTVVGSANLATSAYISDSFAIGNVVGKVGASNIGGLIGNILFTEVERSYSTAGNVSGSTNIGGLLGAAGMSEVRESYSINSLVTGDYHIGGLVGKTNQTKFENTYTRSNIELTASIAKQFGGAGYAGQIDSASSISFSYAAGELKGADEFLFGFSYENMVNRDRFFELYYDRDRSGLENKEDDIGVGLPTASLKDIALFTRNAEHPWDPTIWAIDPTINGGYPHFLPRSTSPETDIPAPAFVPDPVAGPGQQPGTTSLSSVNPEAGNHLAVQVSSSIIPIPNVGDDAPTGANVIAPYSEGDDIPDVDITTNRYVGLYEIEPTGKIVRFTLVTLTEEDIQSGPQQAPEFNPKPFAEPGIQFGTTRLDGVIPALGNQLVVKTSHMSNPIPNEGDNAPIGIGVINPYVLGNDIPTVDPIINRYVGLYEVDSMGRVVKFSEVIITEEDINTKPLDPDEVPNFEVRPTIEPGSQTGTTRVSDADIEAGNHLVVQVASNSIRRPKIGDEAPSGVGVINPYSVGDDIPGVDITTNLYVGVYEVDPSGMVVRFRQFKLSSEDIKTPSDPDQGPDPSPNPGNGSDNPSPVNPTPALPTPTAPVKEEIVIDVKAGAGETITQTRIERTTEPNGRVKDNVTLTGDRALEVVEQLKNKTDKTARMVIPDERDRVAETQVTIPRSSVTTLAHGEANLEIYTDNVRIFIPNDSLNGFNTELYFRLVPLKQERERREVETRAKQEEQVREMTNGQEIKILGRPMTIETNMQNRLVVLTLPLKDSVPKDKAAQQDIFDNLVIFIEHSDGTKELIRGEIVSVSDRELGVQFGVDKFSTFTILYMEGSKEYYAALQQEEEERSKATKGTHLPYIYGFSDGTFRPAEGVTRAQMAAMLSRNIDDIQYTGDGTSSFADTDSKHWAFEEMEIVNEIGLMIGLSDGSFGTSEGITRAQMAMIVDRWMKQQVKAAVPVNATVVVYNDLSQGHWAYEAISNVQAYGIMVGYEDQRFKPGQRLTRAEAVKVLNRLFERGPLYGVTRPSFSDVATSYWAFNEVEEAAQEHHWRLDEKGNEVLE
ncbi:hypothetical protein J2S11_003131 [Bacillus horti]|uniref:SLH domain-containing protein n=1 Tax=Caldalkalibacillus horti TaxID=77523 RepID=A0ABT9W1T9_9BACI|nr:hypothetical protein [Bacillus horti]